METNTSDEPRHSPTLGYRTPGTTESDGWVSCLRCVLFAVIIFYAAKLVQTLSAVAVLIVQEYFRPPGATIWYLSSDAVQILVYMLLPALITATVVLGAIGCLRPRPVMWVVLVAALVADCLYEMGTQSWSYISRQMWQDQLGKSAAASWSIYRLGSLVQKLVLPGVVVFLMSRPAARQYYRKTSR